MKELWKTLPIDIIHIILKYNNSIKLRNNKYMNQIINVNNKYNFIINKIIFKKHIRFNKDNQISFINIYIKNTKKSLYYYGTKFGYRLTLHNENENKDYGIKILYSNITHNS
jgi:hypothetical protein